MLAWINPAPGELSLGLLAPGRLWGTVRNVSGVIAIGEL